MSETKSFGYIPKEVLELISFIELGEGFIDSYSDLYLKDNNDPVDLYAMFAEAKTYYNTELEKLFPSADSNASVYQEFVNRAIATKNYIAIIDNQIKKYNLYNY